MGTQPVKLFPNHTLNYNTKLDFPKGALYIKPMAFAAQVALAIEAGERFLIENLWDGGLVPCYLEGARPDTNPFAISFLLNAVRFSENDSLKALAKLAAETLWEMRDSFGLWRYYPFLPPDIDDLGAVGYELARLGYPVSLPLDELRRVRSPSGLYHTWLFSENKRPPDMCANANLLRLEWALGRKDTLLLKALEERAEEPCCPYYVNEALCFAYFLSRAGRDGVPLSAKARGKLTHRALEAQKPDALSLALALNALINLDYKGPELAKLARRLLALQRPDGSWPACPFWLNDKGQAYSSEVLITLLALEALYRLR